MKNLSKICLFFALISTWPVQSQYVQEFPPYLPPDFYELFLNGGRVQAISVHPDRSRCVIIAKQFGGLWKTENRGLTWRHLNNLNHVFTVDVQYAPDGHTVVATVGRDCRTQNGGGIYISPDAGETWSRPPSGIIPSSNRTPSRPTGYAISFAPDNENKIYVGTDYGIAVSNNKGSTWDHFMLETTSGIWGDSLQNAVFSVRALPNNRAIVSSRTGIYRTDDGGSTWRRIREGNFEGSGFNGIDASPKHGYVFIIQDYNNLLFYEVGRDSWRTIPLPGGQSRGPFVRVSKASGN